MMELAGAAYGDRVCMVSSLDPEHSVENIIDGNHGTFWISTGLFPQEIILELVEPTLLSSIKIASTHVRKIRIEGCHEMQPHSFAVVAESEFKNMNGCLQVNDLPCSSALLKFVRVVFVSGWSDFCTCHNLFMARPGTRCQSSHPQRFLAIGSDAEIHSSMKLHKDGARACEQNADPPQLKSHEEGLRVSDQNSDQNHQYWLTEVQDDWRRFEDAPRAVRADREVALAAVAQDRRALEFVPEKVRVEIEIVLGLAASPEDEIFQRPGSSMSRMLGRPGSRMF